MKLWKISQDVNNQFDTYDSAVVAAETEDEARAIHPHDKSFAPESWGRAWESWVETPAEVRVEYLGEAKPGTEPGQILASFNAG